MGYKVLFLTLSIANSGLWLRYTTIDSSRTRYSAFWLTHFKPGNPRGFMIKIRDNMSISEDSITLNKQLYSIRDRVSTGGYKGLEWNLRFKGGIEKYNPVPLLYRILRRKSKYVIVNPNTLFNGTVIVNNEEIKVENYRGMIGFISGDKYLDHWIWTHCSSFEEDPEGWIDILVASPDGKRRVLFGLLKYDNKLIHIGKILGVNYIGEVSHEKFNANVKVGDYSISIEARALKENMIIAKYEDPANGARYCHNTEIADAVISIEKGELKMKLSCNKRAFYEYALTKVLDESIERIKEITL
ncbi:MAG: hypothetical protein QW208_00020 [Acidilobaceae archaeon]